MTQLSPDQRNDYYLTEAARSGIHKPILAALYAVLRQPSLADGEVGLGIAPANRVALEQVNRFPAQVLYAANTLRGLTNALIAEGWQANELWNAAQGRYSDRLISRIAEGYTPPPDQIDAAQLEACDPNALLAAYLEDLKVDSAADLPPRLADLDQTLLAFADRVPPHYNRLDFQRQALLEAARLWRQLDSQQALIEALQVPLVDGVTDESILDKALVEFIQQVPHYYAGYPNQREALIRLVQLWSLLSSREEAIQWLLGQPYQTAETRLQVIDPVLIAFVEGLPALYQGRGDQRFALTEAYRLWQGLDSRTAALQDLGVDPEALVQNAENPEVLKDSARQIDRALLEFLRRVPVLYAETEAQREALLYLVQLWRQLDNRIATIQSLFEDLRRMVRAERHSPDAMPAPKPLPLPPRPVQWTPANLQLAAAIIPNGSFTWAEATHGGTSHPPDQATVEAIIRIATLAQRACDRIGRPFHITRWYFPAEIHHRSANPFLSRYGVGDAIDFYCEGLTGNQLYRALDPWWPGGLGRYSRFPYLCHLDARTYQARWTH